MYVLIFLFLFNTCFAQIKVHFTRQDNYNSVETALANFIDSVQPPTTIYFCIYRINNPTIIKSIEDAYKRGLNIYALFDTDLDTSVFKVSFPYKKIGNSSKLMHNKFVVVESSKVWSGSYNFTVDANNQDNFALEIFSKELAEIYTKAFWYMWQNGPLISQEVLEFNGKEVKLNDNTKLTVYFNPYSDTPQLKDIIINNFQNAKSIYFAVCWFVDKNLFFKDVFVGLLDNSVEINGIIDDSEINFETYYALKQTGLNINFDARKTYYEYGLMHHKFCLVSYSTQTPKLICGSPNWTQNGLCFGGYYENMSIIESKEIADIFYKEYKRIYNEIMTSDITTQQAPILITEVAPDEPSNQDWVELFVVVDGNYEGCKVYCGYPKKLIAELPNLTFKKGDFIIVQTGAIQQEIATKENFVIIYTTDTTGFYNSDGVVYISDTNDNWIDAVGWSNRDKDMALQAKDAYYRMRARNMWKDGPDLNETATDIEIQLSLVDWSLGSNQRNYSIQRYTNTAGLPKDTNSLSDWFTSFSTKGFGYKEIISTTYKILEVDKNTNPFSPKDPTNNFVKINFNLPDSNAVKTIKIFDLSGKEVTKLLDEDRLQNNATLKGIGVGSVTWDGRDSNGIFVESGVYIVYLEAYNPNNAKKYTSKSVVVISNRK